MPSLQVSVPGHATMSMIVPAPRSPSPILFNSRYNSGKSISLTQRKTRFCSTVVRMFSPQYFRARSATCRACDEVMSPMGSEIVTTA